MKLYFTMKKRIMISLAGLNFLPDICLFTGSPDYYLAFVGYPAGRVFWATFFCTVF